MNQDTDSAAASRPAGYLPRVIRNVCFSLALLAAPATQCGDPPPTTNPGFVNLAPTMGAPLPTTGTPVNPPPPTGWTWYQIEGTRCRDGSPAGFYVQYSSSDKLLMYLEGGGACVSPGFCTYNPKNVNEILAGDGQTAIGSIGGAIAGRQQPGTRGIFDNTNQQNPYRGWNKVYVPYCTGDVHYGSKPNATVPGVAGVHQFVGAENMRRFTARIVPTFKDRVQRVVITGASAGAFGAGLNASMVQDSFGNIPLDVVMDSGVPFADQFMPICMQQKWRELWNLNASFPPDCTECRQADGGGLLRVADFLLRKHGRARLALVTAQQDDIMRLFFSIGNNNCATFETSDPVLNFLAGSFPGPTYQAALDDLRLRYLLSGRFASFYLGGPNLIHHQHTWRDRFYDPLVTGTGTSIAQWNTNFLNGNLQHIGP